MEINNNKSFQLDYYKKVSAELSTEERLFIVNKLENKSCMNCANGVCRVPYIEKIGFEDDGKPIGSNCIGWYNDHLIGKSKVLKKTNIHELR